MQKLDCIIIGAGFSGLYQLHCLRDKLKLNTLVIGIHIQVLVVILRVLPMVLPFLKKFLKIGLGKKDIQSKK